MKLWLVVLGVCGVSSVFVAQQPFRSSVDIVHVTATVVDRQGKFVAGLTKDDFRVIDGGVEQPIAVYSAEPQPVSIAFLIDISESMEGQPFAQARHAIDLFAQSHLGPYDEVFVCLFNTVTSCASSWTRDRSVLAATLAGIEPRGSTSLFDALAPVLERFGEARHPKQVLVILSDGKDMRSQQSLSEVHDVLRRGEVLTYAIAFDFRALDPMPQRDIALNRLSGADRLRTLTAATGGGTLRAVTPQAIPAAVKQIANELGRQYQLGYYLPRRADGRYHEIKVEVKRRGLEVRARRGYLARLQENK